MRAIGIGIPFFRRRSGVDAQAQVHYNRVIADGGVVPSGLSGVNAFFSAVKAIYGTTDINTAISAAYDAHYLGYKLGAGSGTTLGQAAQKMYAPKGIFGGIGTGSAFWEGVGVGQNNVVTPDAPANRITGDVDIICYLLHTSNGGFNSIVSKNDGGTNRAYNLAVQTNTPTFYYGAATLNTASATANITSGSSLWLRVTRNATNGEIRFFTSNDASTTNPQSVIWTQLGATISGVTGTLNSSGVLPLIVGGYISTGSGFTSTERIFRLTIANSIGGTPVVDFNANQYTGANTWTSTTSEVWTVNSTGAGLADVVQTTAASQPLLLVKNSSDANYWFGSKVSGNYCSTPHAASNSFRDDFEIIAYNIKVNTISGDNNIVGKFTAAGRQFILGINSTQKAYLVVSTDGSTNLTYESTVTAPNANVTYSLKATRDKANGLVKFYTSTDSGVNWTQLGANIASTTSQLFASIAILEIGSYLGSGTSGNFGGNIQRVTIANSIGGTPVVDFNPASYNPSVSQTQWSSATGEVWSLNVGTAATGYKGQLVSKTIVMSDGVDDFISVTGMTSRQYFTRYVACIPYTNPNTAPRIISGNADTHLIFKTGTNAFEAFNGVQLAFTGEVVNILQALIVDYNSTNSKTFVNNAGETSGNTGTTSSTAISLFGSVTGTTLSNVLINTVIQPITVDNATIRTAVYNYIRSINGNSF